MKITVKNDSITRVLVDAIVNPANSFGYMGGGVAKVIKQVGGEEIEEEAIIHAPIEVGTALATTAGELRCSAVIHAPTMRDPAEKTDEKCVEEAMRAAMELADEMGYKKIAVPGMGTGVGAVPKKAAARVMIETIRGFEPEHLEEVILIDVDEEMVEAWKQLLE